jgi:hypothetical protein
VNEITGVIMVMGHENWSLHLIDINFAMGNLLGIVGA